MRGEHKSSYHIIPHLESWRVTKANEIKDSHIIMTLTQYCGDCVIGVVMLHQQQLNIVSCSFSLEHQNADTKETCTFEIPKDG